jgi:hypothetical protein
MLFHKFSLTLNAISSRLLYLTFATSGGVQQLSFSSSSKSELKLSRFNCGFHLNL